MIEEVQRELSHQVRHQSRTACTHSKHPCRKLSFPASCQLPSRTELPSTRMESSRPRRKSRKLIDRISTSVVPLKYSRRSELPFRLGQLSELHSQCHEQASDKHFRVRVVWHPLRQLADPRKVPRAALDVISNLLCHCFLRLWILGLFALQRYCPRHHRAPERHTGLACRKTTFKHMICASPGGHHHNRSESTPDKLSEEWCEESAVCTNLPTARPVICRAPMLWNSCVRSHHFNELRPRCHNFQFLLNIEHTPPHYRQIVVHQQRSRPNKMRCHTLRRNFSQSPNSRIYCHWSIPNKNPPPIRTTCRHKPMAATTNLLVSLIHRNGCQLCMESNIICFTNSQQTVQRTPRTSQLKVFRRGNSDCQSAQPQRQPTPHPKHSTTSRTHVHGCRS